VRMRRVIKDMVVVITGASAGIGKNLASKLSDRGAHLVLCARRGEILDALNESLGGRHRCVQADVGDSETGGRLVHEAITRFGRLDTFVCNAGYGIIQRVADMQSDQMEMLFTTNVFATSHCISAAVPVMQHQSLRDGYRGQIIVVSSAAAKRGLPYFGHYSATKAAQVSLAEALRVEVNSDRIAVTSVLPIGTETDFFATAQKCSGITMAPRRKGELWQSVDYVTDRMVMAIERPRPEVWTSPAMRLLLNAGGLFPAVLDRIMSKDLRKYEGQRGGRE
jgi:short-subunit dehydrogenase